jgi:hypothetical protein
LSPCFVVVVVATIIAATTNIIVAIIVVALVVNTIVVVVALTVAVAPYLGSTPYRPKNGSSASKPTAPTSRPHG